MSSLILPKNFRLSRNFSIASFLGTLLASIFLAYLFNQVTLDNIVQTSERNNVTLTQTFLNSVNQELSSYLLHAEDKKYTRHSRIPISNNLEKTINNLMVGTPLLKISIFDIHGTVIFSSKNNQIGKTGTAKTEVLSALSGKVSSKLNYGDKISSFKERTPDILASYIPIYQRGSNKVIGVFELHLDVTVAIQIADTAQLITLIGVIVILTLLYILLLQFVYRSEKIITKQQSTILKRTESLEKFSSDLLTAEDKRDKRIALDLHEGLAQTLTAIKMHIENLKYDNTANSKQTVSINAIVLMIQSAIRKTRDLAMDLRPSTLDYFGLAPTIKWACEKVSKSESLLDVTTQIDIDEKQIPSNLKIVIYHILMDSLASFSLDKKSTKVALDLRNLDNSLVLTFEYQNQCAPEELNSVRERSILSGGNYEILNNDSGGTIYRSSWCVH